MINKQFKPFNLEITNSGGYTMIFTEREQRYINAKSYLNRKDQERQEKISKQYEMLGRALLGLMAIAYLVLAAVMVAS
jgi:replicative superfamily II helicase